MSLSAPLGSHSAHRFAIDRDDGPSNPIKIIHRIVVWVFDELGVPKP